MRRFNPLLLTIMALLLVFCRSTLAMPPVPTVFPHRVVFSPDGTLVAVLGVPRGGLGLINSNFTARVWTVADGKIYRNYAWAEVDNGWLAFSPDNQFIALADKGQVRVIHLASNQVRWTLNVKAAIEEFFFSPDGKWLVVQSPWHSSRTATPAQKTGYRDFEIWRLGGTDGEVARNEQRVHYRLFDVMYPTQGPLITEHVVSDTYPLCNPSASSLNTWSIAFSPDGQYQSFNMKDPQAVQLWQTTPCQLKHNFARPSLNEWSHDGTQLSFSPRSRWLVGKNYDTITLWDVIDGTERTIRPPVYYMLFGFGTLQASPELDPPSHLVPKVALSPNEDLLAITQGYSPHRLGNYPVLILYDTKSGQMHSVLS